MDVAMVVLTWLGTGCFVVGCLLGLLVLAACLVGGADPTRSQEAEDDEEDRVRECVDMARGLRCDGMEATHGTGEIRTSNFRSQISPGALARPGSEQERVPDVRQEVPGLDVRV